MMLKTLYMRLRSLPQALAYGDLANGLVAELQHLPWCGILVTKNWDGSSP